MSQSEPEPQADSATEVVKRPWWTYAVPFAGRPPKLARRQWRVMGLLGAAELFDHYDIAILSLALSQIQAGLLISEADVGGVGALVRLGTVGGFALMIFADRVGRRRLLLFTILCFSLATFATAFAQTQAQFVFCQMLARMFVGAEIMLGIVVVTEELNAEDRGWGVGMLGALGALGFGVAAIIFAAIDLLPGGWRALYVVGVLPLLVLAWFRRNLEETRRFEVHKSQRSDAGDLRAWLLPMRNLVRMYPWRVAALAAAVFPFEILAVTSITFNAKWLQEQHAYSPGQVTALFLVAGALGIAGNLLAGRLADRYGRRLILCIGMAAQGVAVAGFYNLSGWVLPLFWIGLVFSLQGVGVLFKALGGELFPTSYRSTGSGIRAVVSTLGAFVGLSLEGPLYERLGSHGDAITALIPVLIIPILMVILFVPETASRELEDVSPERG